MRKQKLPRTNLQVATILILNVLGLAAGLSACIGVAEAGSGSAKPSNNFPHICRDIVEKINQPSYTSRSIEMIAAGVTPDPLQGNKYLNLDIDIDGKSDEVLGGCSDSSEPADGCVLTYRLSSNDKEFSHKFPIDERFIVVTHKSRVILISSKLDSKFSKKLKNIYLLTKNGLKNICR